MADDANAKIPLTYESRQPRRRWPWLLPLCVGFAFAALFLVCWSNMVLSAHDTNPREKSESNLRQIGQAILMYNNDFKGAYPDALPTLVMTEDIGAEAFVSPLSNDTLATGPTTRAIAANLLAGGHCSYVYLGRGWNQKSVPANAVVAYEKRAPPTSGANVLFGDGRVEYCTPRWWANYYRKQANARTHVRRPVTMPASD